MFSRIVMALCGTHALNPTDVLPPGLVPDIFLRLPADERARAACVCPSWHNALAEPALWRRLNLSRRSGVKCRVDGAALRAAAARARGGLEALDVTGREGLWAALRDVAAANVALRELRTLEDDEDEDNPMHLRKLQALLAVAPALQTLGADVHCSSTLARALLRNEPPYGPLRLRKLAIACDGVAGSFLPAVAALLAHPSLKDLALWGDHDITLEELEPVVDAVLTQRLTGLDLYDCVASPAVAPALARVLGSASLTKLNIGNNEEDMEGPTLLDGPAAALLSRALRANRTLNMLSLYNVGLWNDVPAAVELLGALTGHASLGFLNCSDNAATDSEEDAAAIGAALGALVAADAPALIELHMRNCSMGDEGLGPLCNALPCNTHLQRLSLNYNGMSDTFATQRLLPAVCANFALRDLTAGDFELADLDPDDEASSDDNDDELNDAYQAMKFVAGREAARVAAESAAGRGAGSA